MMFMMIMVIVIMMMMIKMKMIRRKWWASDSDKCEGRSVACPPLSRVYCTLPCIFHFTSLYFCACTFLYFLCLTCLFILQMFFPTFVNCTRLMYPHCTFIFMSLSLSDKVWSFLKKYVILLKVQKKVTKVHIEYFFSQPLPLYVSISSFVSTAGCHAGPSIQLLVYFDALVILLWISRRLMKKKKLFGNWSFGRSVVPLSFHPSAPHPLP